MTIRCALVDSETEDSCESVSKVLGSTSAAALLSTDPPGPNVRVNAPMTAMKRALNRLNLTLVVCILILYVG